MHRAADGGPNDAGHGRKALQKHEIRAIFDSLSQTLEDPACRQVAPESELTEYSGPRALGSRNKTPIMEPAIVLRPSVVEPAMAARAVAVPMKPSAEAGARRAAAQATVITKALRPGPVPAIRGRRVLVRLAAFGAGALVVAFTGGLVLHSRSTSARTPAASSDPPLSPPPLVETARALRAPVVAPAPTFAEPDSAYSAHAEPEPRAAATVAESSHSRPRPPSPARKVQSLPTTPAEPPLSPPKTTSHTYEKDIE
jgi:hypothetical protein